MKKIILGISVFLLTVTLAACTGVGTLGSFTFSSDQEVFSFAAVSTSSLLSDSQIEPLSSSHATAKMSSSVTIQTLEEIQPYLEMFEKLLTQNNGLSVTESVSENPLYETKMEFVVSDLFGDPITYVMYYNETLVTDDEDDEQEIDEIKYTLEGLLLVGATEYQITGKKEIEDGEEKLTFKSQIDENNYVESKYKTEDDETKFYITVVENGVIVSESRIKIEMEDDETKFVLEYNAGLDESKYSFKLETEDGINVLKIKYEITTDGITEEGKMKVQVIIDEVTLETSYLIFVEPDDEEAFEHEEDRNIEHDDDNDDDEYDENEDDENEDEEENDETNPDDLQSGATK